MDALQQAQALISYDSVSCRSNEPVSDYVSEQLERLGFEVERLSYQDPQGVTKCCVAGKLGDGVGGVGYFGHTDVVPVDDWAYEGGGAFEATTTDDRLYGRGSCDMKGSVAAALAAAERLTGETFPHPLYLVCTADEEIGYGGAKHVAAHSRLYREMVEHNTLAIIGEPTELQVVYAHKGSYGFRAISHGESAHSSTAEGCNANLAMIPFLVEMKAIHDQMESDSQWQNNEFSPPTISWNIGVNDHTHAINIKPPQSVCTVYFRPMPGVDGEALLTRAADAAERCGLEFRVDTKNDPLYVDPQSPHIQQLAEISGVGQPGTVSYGTDGAAFAELKRMAVVGPGSIRQAHTCDEWIALEQLHRGVDFYEQVFRRWRSAEGGGGVV